jgi:4-alpha-glucanotransferase
VAELRAGGAGHKSTGVPRRAVFREAQEWGRSLKSNGGGEASEGFDPRLAKLAQAHGVLVSYRDSRGQLRVSPESAVRAVLRALEVDPDRESARPSRRGTERHLPPVIVAWEGRVPDLGAYLPEDRAVEQSAAAVRFTLVTEAGEELGWEVRRGQAAAEVTKGPHVRRLPWGRHLLRMETARRGARRRREAEEAFVISAPRRCWSPEEEQPVELRGMSLLPEKEATRTGAPREALRRAPMEAPTGAPRQMLASAPREAPGCPPWAALAGRPWGVFTPTYALRSARDWGAGDFGELEMLSRWVAGQGGSVVATLPLLAPFPSPAGSSASCGLSGEPFDPSPYRPSSRLFWNEFYLALEWLPEWGRCASARLFWEDPVFQAERRRLREAPLVDHPAVAALKRKMLRLLAAGFFAEAGAEEKRSFTEYVAANPLAREFAVFQAAAVRAAGSLQEVDECGATERAVDYHLYCQWRMEQQLARLASGSGVGLLLDLPLGVHPAGFDAAKWPHLFVGGMSSGAPPDDFFAEGQVWDSPPLHPQTDRRQGYRYLSACLSLQMRHASYLRIDHMMSFHRLFWVPRGMSAREGVYVTYPAEELYAVLALESHRHRTLVMGEDLGTVPAGVRSSMRRHGVGRTWVFQSAVRGHRSRGQAQDQSPENELRVAPVPAGAVATLNTHDMVPFAGFLRGEDIRRREEAGGVKGAAARRAWAARRRLVAAMIRQPGLSPAGSEATATSDAHYFALLKWVLGWVARSKARLVLINLEDLWGETEPQNLPGSGPERPNWRKKAALTLEELAGRTRNAHS